MGKKKDYKKFMQMFQSGAFPMPPMPFAPVPGNKNEVGENAKAEINKQKENVKSTAKSAWTQKTDRQKSTVDNRREQWKQYFDYRMEMQDTFAALIPDDISFLPSFVQMLPVSPKAFIEQLKEFEIMANEHFVAQMDSVMDFYFKGREQFFDMLSAAMDKKEEDARTDDNKDSAVENAEAEVIVETKDEKKPRAARKPRTRKTTGTKTAAKAAAEDKVEEKAEAGKKVAEEKVEAKAEKKPRAKAAKKSGTKTGKKAGAGKEDKAEEKPIAEEKPKTEEIVESKAEEAVTDNAVNEAEEETVESQT